MTEAYEIGITLALQDGVSDGIAIIRRDLAALDRAIAATSANLAHLHQAETSPSRAPALPSKPSPSPQSRASEPAMPSTPAKTQAIADQPATQLARPPVLAAPIVTFDLASPSPAPISVSSPRHLPVSIPSAQFPVLQPNLAPTPVNLPSIPPAAPTHLLVPPSPTASFVPPSSVAPSPLPVAPSSPYSLSMPLPDNRPAASAPLTTLAHRSSPPALPRTPAHASPSLAPPIQAREPPRSSPTVPPPIRAAPPPASVPVVRAAPPASSAPTTRTAPTQQPTRSVPAAPPFQPAPSSDSTSRLDRSVTGSHAPPPQAPAPITLQGDITLDGARVGRWMASTLARQAARPAAGPTGPDPRQTPLWS